jgi:hypothetical protein
MGTYQNIDNESQNNILHEPQADYQREEINRLKDALNRSYTERFLFATRLYKIQQTMQRAKITYKPDTLNK